MARKQLVVSGFVSLLLGLSIYLVLDHNTYVSKMILTFFHFKPLDVSQSYITQFLKNWGADFLWMLSFTLLVQSILNLDERRYFKLMFCSLLGVLYEIFQHVGLVGGTADAGDIFAYMSGSFAAIMIVKFHKEKKYD